MMKEPKLRFKADDGTPFQDWEEKTFNDIADYKKGPFGSALKKKIFVPKSNNTVKVYEQQNAISKDWRLERYFVTDEYFQTNLKSFSVSGGDIIVSCAGTIGEIYELPNDAEEGIINQALMRVRIKKSVINSMVFKCVFDKMISSEGIKISNGSALKNIPPFADMKKQTVFLPSLPEQQKIASLFTELDTLIQSAEKELDGYRELKQGMLQKMFPKKGEKIPEIRFPEFTGDWEQHKFEDVVTIGSGKDYKHLESGNVPVYGTGGYMLSVNQALSENEDAVGIGRKGTIDKPYILRAPFWTVDTLFYCIPNKGFDLTFTNCLFQNVDWKKKDESTGVPSLSKVIINNVKTYVPSLSEQQRIGEYFSNLDNLITLQQKEIDGYKELKKGLLQQMFC